VQHTLVCADDEEVPADRVGGYAVRTAVQRNSVNDSAAVSINDTDTPAVTVGHVYTIAGGIYRNPIWSPADRDRLEQRAGGAIVYANRVYQVVGHVDPVPGRIVRYQSRLTTTAYCAQEMQCSSVQKREGTITKPSDEDTSTYRIYGNPIRLLTDREAGRFM